MRRKRNFGEGEDYRCIYSELGRGDADDRVDLGEICALGGTGEAGGVFLGRRDVSIFSARRGVQMRKFVLPFRDFAGVCARRGPQKL